MTFLAQQLLWGAVLPGLITAAFLTVGWRAWRREGVPAHWGTPIALAAGYLFAHWRIVGLPLSFPPVDANEWLFVMLLAGLALAALMVPTYRAYVSSASNYGY